MRLAGRGAIVGVDPWRYLDCKDPAQLAVISAVIESGEEFLNDLLDDLAHRLARATWGGA